MTTVLDRLNHSLHQVMEKDPSVFVLGEDILDPYGGAFKVTRGLSTRFPDRVLTTPISEAAITGLATGMALRGLRPVVEIMFGDFVTLIADQLINHAAKFRWMYNDQVRVPMVVRTPMGGRRGYGPTHSQTLEKLFLGVPGLRVLAPNTLDDPAELLAEAVADDGPVLFIENKLLYTCTLLEEGKGDLVDFKIERGGGKFPCSVLRTSDRADLTIACYGYAFELARRTALDLLYEYEIFADVVVISQLSPYDTTGLVESLSRSGRLLTVEEGSRSFGWGAEVASRAVESGIPGLVVRRVGALDLPVANSRPLEEAILPGVKDVLSSALELVGRKMELDHD